MKFIQDESIAYLKCLLWWNIRCDVEVVHSGMLNLIVINHRIRCTPIQGLGYGPQGGDCRRDWQCCTVRSGIHMKGNNFGYVGNSMLLTRVQEQCQLELIPCAETRIERMFSQVSARRRPFSLCSFHPSAFCLDTMQGSVDEDL